MQEKEIIDIIRLSRSENVGIKTFYNLIEMFKSAGNALKNIQEMSLRGGRNKPIKLFSKDDAEVELQKSKDLGAKLVCYREPKYSKALLQIFDPPPILYCLGNLELLNSKCISIVGARNASIAGKVFTSKISKELSNRGFTIVSGLARGIDSSAHESSLPSTIAVIAGGLGHIYPPENKELYEKVATQGLIVSELPVMTRPTAGHFPQRNRIVSGLSLAVIVTEATMKSGSLITARFALEQNREVFAVPGSPLDPRSVGTNKLIKEGAHIVTSSEDIEIEVESIYKMNMSTSLEENTNRFKIEDIETSDQMRQKLLDSLATTPVCIEVLYEELGISIQALLTILLELELAGRISRYDGNKFALINNS